MRMLFTKCCNPCYKLRKLLQNAAEQNGWLGWMDTEINTLFGMENILYYSYYWMTRVFNAVIHAS